MVKITYSESCNILQYSLPCYIIIDTTYMYCLNNNNNKRPLFFKIRLIEVNQKIIMLQRPVIVKPTPGRPDRQIPPRRGKCCWFSQTFGLGVSMWQKHRAVLNCRKVNQVVLILWHRALKQRWLFWPITCEWRKSIPHTDDWCPCPAPLCSSKGRHKGWIW